MKQTKKLWQDTLLYSIAHFGTSLLAFIMLPIYTAYFSPQAFGTWDLFLTTITLLMPLVSFELNSATYRWLLQTSDKLEQAKIISTGFFALLRHMISSALLAIILFLFIDFPFQWQALILLQSMLFFSFLQQYVRGLQLNRLFASMSIMHSIVTISFMIYFIFQLELGVVAFFYAQIIASITVSLFTWMKSKFSQYIIYRQYTASLLSDFYTYAWPIIPATASWWIMTMSDRWFISAFLGLTSNGIYAIALKVPALLLMMNTVFSLAWKDSAIIYYDDANKDAYFTTIFTHYFRFLTTTVIVLILLAKPLIILFIDSAYEAAWQYSGILLIATLFHAFSLFWSAGFHGAKKTTPIFRSSVIGAGVNIVGNFLLIPLFGLYGIAMATMIAFIVTWVMRVKAAEKLFKVVFPVRDMMVLFGGVVVALGVSFSNSIFIIFYGLVVCIIIFIFYNKRLIKAVWYKIFN